MNDALDLKWGARMFEVQVTGDASYMELRKARSDRGCADTAALYVSKKDELLSLSKIGETHRRIGVGLATLHCAVMPRLSRSCRVQQMKMGVVAASRQVAEVAGFRPSTDIFVESSKASAGTQSSPRLIVLRLTHSANLFAGTGNRVVLTPAN